jgi:hypothetical protein
VLLPLAIAGWDSPSSVPTPPDRSWNVWLDPSGTAGAYASRRGGDYWIDVSNVAMFHYSAATGQVTAVAHGPIPERQVRATYHRIVLPWLLQALGYEMLHASAVRTQRGVVAFCGDSGAGKSTIATGLSRRGYPVWADDALLLEVGARIRALALPFVVRLRRESAEFFGLGWRGDGSSCELSGSERDPVDLAAICVLKRRAGSGGGEVTARRRGPAALTALLAHACAFNLADLDRKRRMVAQYLAVADRIPVFEAVVQPGLEPLSELLDQLEARIIHAEPAWAD